MRISVRSDNRRIVIPVPISLVSLLLRCGNLGIRIARKHVDEKTLKYLECVDLRALSRSLMEIRHYKGLNIVEVRSQNGDEVTITI